MSGMGTFRITVRIESHTRRGAMQEIANVLVDTGSEATWIPRTVVESLGIEPEKVFAFVLLTVGRSSARRGSRSSMSMTPRRPMILYLRSPETSWLLDARTLEGLNMKIDPVRHMLVDAGPVDAAAA